MDAIFAAVLDETNRQVRKKRARGKNRTGEVLRPDCALCIVHCALIQISSFMLSSRASTMVGTTLVAFSCTSLGA